MNLCIDAGNSRVKWGWHDGSQWTALASVSLIEFAAATHDINPFAATHANPEKIIISNVAVKVRINYWSTGRAYLRPNPIGCAAHRTPVACKIVTKILSNSDPIVGLR